MTKSDLISWISYWDKASMGPNLHHVRAFSDMAICRKFNRCMSDGLMSEISDLQMWNALVSYREMRP